MVPQSFRNQSTTVWNISKEKRYPFQLSIGFMLQKWSLSSVVSTPFTLCSHVSFSSSLFHGKRLLQSCGFGQSILVLSLSKVSLTGSGLHGNKTQAAWDKHCINQNSSLCVLHQNWTLIVAVWTPQTPLAGLLGSHATSKERITSQNTATSKRKRVQREGGLLKNQQMNTNENPWSERFIALVLKEESHLYVPF